MVTHSDTHILDFLVACCVTASSQNGVRAGELYDAYVVYTTKYGIRENEVLGQTAFGVRMGGLFRRCNRGDGRFYLGIRLKDIGHPST